MTLLQEFINILQDELDEGRVYEPWTGNYNSQHVPKKQFSAKDATLVKGQYNEVGKGISYDERAHAYRLTFMIPKRYYTDRDLPIPVLDKDRKIIKPFKITGDTKDAGDKALQAAMAMRVELMGKYGERDHKEHQPVHTRNFNRVTPTANPDDNKVSTTRDKSMRYIKQNANGKGWTVVHREHGINQPFRDSDYNGDHEASLAAAKAFRDDELKNRGVALRGDYSKMEGVSYDPAGRGTWKATVTKNGETVVTPFSCSIYKYNTAWKLACKHVHYEIPSRPLPKGDAPSIESVMAALELARKKAQAKKDRQQAAQNETD